MNRRERYLETMLFGAPDKIPFAPGGPRESTLRAWRAQGLPENADWFATLKQEIGFEDDPPGKPMPPLGVSFLMNPMFEEKVIEKREHSLVVQDWKGNVCEILDVYDVSYLREAKDFVTRRWLKLPVESREDWEQMKARYDPKDPARFPEDFDARCVAWRGREDVLGVAVHGPYWQLREWVGAEQLCLLFLTDPDLVRDMICFWADFASTMLGEILQHVDIDHFFINEDMAFKEHSFISPDMAREFLAPCWRQWVEQARAGGARVLEVDSDGYAGGLIPVWIEAGFNCSSPNEVAAGCDVVEFRERFGRKMALRGGVDKRLMAKGGRALRDELERIIPAMLKEGGFIPGCDHGVPPDVSWPHFVEYARRLAELTGWVKG